METGVDKCSQDKIDALKYALKEIDNANKVADKNIKGLEKSEDSRKKAQDAINLIAKSNDLVEEKDFTYIDVSGAIDKKLKDTIKKITSDIGLTIEGEINKETLIKAISETANVSVPNKKEEVVEDPVTPTPETVDASK